MAAARSWCRSISATSRRGQKLSTAVAVQIQEELKADKMVEDQTISIVPASRLTPAATKTAGGVIRLRKEKFAAAFPARIRSLANMPKPKACTVEDGKVIPEAVPAVAPDTEVYYLDDGSAGRNTSFRPVLFARPTKPPRLRW